MKKNTKRRITRTQVLKERNTFSSGFTLMELLIGLLVLSLFMVSGSNHLLSLMKRSHEESAWIECYQEALNLSSFIVTELQGIGQGMPLGQEKFSMEDTSLLNRPYPIIPGSDSTVLSYRRASENRFAVLTATFTPDSTPYDFTVTDPALFEGGDFVYLSNAFIGGEEALRGRIRRVVGSTVRLRNNILFSTGASFGAGSHLFVVHDRSIGNQNSQLLYTNDGITNTLHSNATVQFVYREEDGSIVPPPLNKKKIRERVRQIGFTVTVKRGIKDSKGRDIEYAIERSVSIGNLVRGAK